MLATHFEVIFLGSPKSTYSFGILPEQEIHLLFWHTARTSTLYSRKLAAELGFRFLSAICTHPVVERDVFEQRVALAEPTARE